MWLKIMSQSEKLGEGKGHNYGWVVKGTDLFSKSGGQKIASENKSVPFKVGENSFPESWSADKVIHEVGDIVTSPDTKWYAQTGTGGLYTKNGDPAKWVAYEVRDGGVLSINPR
nr:EndoU domain-containing protein [Pseudomonas sp. PICF141]